MKEKGTADILSNVGFSAAEIARLQQFQRDYANNKYSPGSDFPTVTMKDAMHEMENAMNEKEASDILSKAGFSAAQIARLQQLRRDYEDMSIQLPVTNRRHKFSSWLGAIVHMLFEQPYPEWTIYR